MCLFIETLRLENGRICRLQEHEERMSRTRERFGLAGKNCSLWEVVKPDIYMQRTRCRVTYASDILSVEYFDYHPRKVSSLQCVDATGICYDAKWADRSALDRLFAKRGCCDEVLLIQDGRITDTSIANVALWDGKEWHTPSRPLLAGTHRKQLLVQGILREKDILVEDLDRYQLITCFNAMLDFREVELPVSAVNRDFL